MSKWKEIWSRHDANLTGEEDFQTLVMKLKEANGFDVVGEDGISFESWVKHIEETKNLLGDVKSLYEVGCGSGANLVMFQKTGVSIVGGVDYSEKLSRVAAKATGSDDISCGEANCFSTIPKYDAVISDSVSLYLPSLEYAEQMIERMTQKAESVIVLLDVHDPGKKQAWKEHRRAVIEDYDNKYAGLDDGKLFISREFFLNFGKRHGMRTNIYETNIDNYWNGQYTYNVFMYKN